MNTLDQLFGVLKQNPDFLDALAPVVELAFLPRDAQLLGSFRLHEHRLLLAMRALSCCAMAKLLQSYDELVPKVLEHNDLCFERERRCPRTYLGVDGPVRVMRWLYRNAETGQTICPLELRAGIVESTLTPAAAKLELGYAANDDYRSAEKMLQEAYVLPRSKSCIQRDMAALCERLDEQQQALEEVRNQSLEPVEGVASISVSIDRTGLPFEEPLPAKPGRPKKGAPKRPCQVIHRQVYCVSLTLHDAQGEALVSQRFGALPGQGDQIVEQARACLAKLVEQYPKAALVQLNDGAEEMHRRGAQILEGYEVTMQLVDAWHAVGYVRKAFEAVGYSQAERDKLVGQLLRNKRGVKDILIRLRTQQVKRRVKEVDEAERYLTNNEARMGYAQARERGLPIGSGNVEATCKCVVAVRFKRSGARWKEPGASTLLRVRAWRTSGQGVWDPICEAFLSSYVMPIAA